MPYLSEMWTLQEAVTWISTRDPGSLASIGNRFGATALKDPPVPTYPINRRRWHQAAVREEHLGESRSFGPSYQILDRLVLGILSGEIETTALNIETGRRQSIADFERMNLQFYIAADLPGMPVGFRYRIDRILRWGEPMVAAADVMKLWPRQRPIVVGHVGIQDGV
jgi:hypothetical protein